MVVRVLPRLRATLLRFTLVLLLCLTIITILNQLPSVIGKENIQQQRLLSYSLARRNLSIKKTLPSAVKFNFSQYISRRNHYDKTKTLSYEIDPRYGVEMHLVPTGPNPLHH
ncbi:hypothetical protein CTI12_AA575630 [Artemisia annua]|uniref:Uncharacterized protein n=1 Tax=Artemisia annua TaxID=35608 RepID=A0A2U1KQN3_ARTAN|nr:hypothetical protein CTI12_AA575630 [Artemisia annua]